MDKKILKAGFAGSGFAARFHYDALAFVNRPRVEATGIYSRTNTHAQALPVKED